MKGVREHCGGDRKGISIFREYGYVGRNGNSQKIKVTMGFFLGQSLNWVENIERLELVDE